MRDIQWFKDATLDKNKYRKQNQNENNRKPTQQRKAIFKLFLRIQIKVMRIIFPEREEFQQFIFELIIQRRYGKACKLVKALYVIIGCGLDHGP